MNRPTVAVVGGGLTGLATAWHLCDTADVIVLEASDRVGGQVRTVQVAGAALDVGADAFLARGDDGQRLLRSLGFSGAELATPVTGQVQLWVRGRARGLPQGTVLGAPADPVALARSGVLSARGLGRALLEPGLPRRRVIGDRSVAELVGERFGREVVDVLVEPLLGGVYAGSADRLSARAAAAPIWDAAMRHRSLLRGLRAHRAARAGDRRPVFVTIRGGLQRLTDRLADELAGSVRCDTRVRHLEEASQGGWTLRSDAGTFHADHVVLALPAARSAELLHRVHPDAAGELAGIRTASVGVVALAYDRPLPHVAPSGSGVLVPRCEGRLVKAVTIASNKWPHHAQAPAFLVRASVGRVDDRTSLSLDDETLAERVDAEVRSMLGLGAPAHERRVVRWPDALPQYEVGHHARLARLGQHLRGFRGLHLAGASYDGIGLAARARDAARVAAAITAGR